MIKEVSGKHDRDDDPDVTREPFCIHLTPVELMRVREAIRRARVQAQQKTDAEALMSILEWAHAEAARRFKP